MAPGHYIMKFQGNEHEVWIAENDEIIVFGLNDPFMVEDFPGAEFEECGGKEK